MKSYSIFTKNNLENEIKKNLDVLLLKSGFVLNEGNPEYIFVIGGDGTVLRAFRKYFEIIDNATFVVIHDGTLGFFADFEKENLQLLIDTINNKNYKIVKRGLVEMQINSKLGKKTKLTALNEVRLESIRQTLITDVIINQSHLEIFRGNGFCISTPSGSTAYNKSLKGAIVQTNLNVFQVAEIASINHNKYHSLNSPLILSSDSKIVFKPIPNSHFAVGADTEFWSEPSIWLKNDNDDIDEIICGVSEKSANFIVPESVHFADRLKRCFII